MNKKNLLEKLGKFELAYLRKNEKISRVHNDIIGRKKEMAGLMEDRRKLHETILELKSRMTHE